MGFIGEKHGIVVRLGVWILPLVFLCGCASNSPEVKKPFEDGHVVVGSGTSAERSVINASNQRVFNLVHTENPASPATPNASTAPSTPNRKSP